jgi:hypothetical protein
MGARPKLAKTLGVLNPLDVLKHLGLTQSREGAKGEKALMEHAGAVIGRS